MFLKRRTALPGGFFVNAMRPFHFKKTGQASGLGL
jgi:hypothetical protein